MHIHGPESEPYLTGRFCVSVCMVQNREKKAVRGRQKEKGNPEAERTNAKGSEAVPDYVYLQAVKAMSSLFLLGGVPGLASCQPSREPNDSFDPIRIGAKSTLCSLRAGTCQLTTRPPWIRPYVPSSLAQ